MGYHQAGFTEIVGVDINPQPNYPFDFVQQDISEWTNIPAGFDFVHASPPCQAFSRAQRLRSYDHPNLIPKTHDLLFGSGLPWVVENVPGAPLMMPVTLCGAMFGLGTYRHRLFSWGGFALSVPQHPTHNRPTAKMGRPIADGEMMHVVGNFSGAAAARKAMGIEWMTRNELREAIPPAYTAHIGTQFFNQARALSA